MRLIVADSGPLIALSCSGHINILLSIVNKLIITETVFLECTEYNNMHGAAEIQTAVASGRITKVSDPDIGIFGEIDGLDPGEALAISQAFIMASPILVDDAIGRQIAKAHGVGVVGSCGILLVAKQRGLITEVGPILEIWKRKIGYFLSAALVNEVLTRAGERV